MAGDVSALAAVSLDDKWDLMCGRVMLNGVQAIARVLLAQRRSDERAGLRTAGYISGYRGSPLGNVDTMLWSIGKRLEASDIRFVPGVNEDMAATAVRGTQQLDAVPGALYDGVFAAWYGKGPGVDRSGDALKHGNFAGAHKNGGVVIFYGDDHGGKSSSIAHHSEQAMAAAFIPSLYPANAREIIEFGQFAYAMSRYSGSWIGLKLVNEVAEQTATIDIDLDAFAPNLPEPAELPPEGVHARTGAFGPLREEQIVSDYRLPLVESFVRSNPIDRTEFLAERPKLGLVTAGKSYADTRQALSLLDLDDERAAALGLSLFKVGCIWPLEPTKLRAFCSHQRRIFVIEEKKAFIEPQLAAILVNEETRPTLVGKRDENGVALLPLASQLEPVRIALTILDQLVRAGVSIPQALSARASALEGLLESGGEVIPLPRRSPYFCSGCPHNRSTRIPEGSTSMTGIGCHTMVNFVRPTEALLPTHMGGEGGNWMGLAPFTGTKHIFQNMGDGTYYHSGLLAIRAAVASGVNITYKILYNDAVAMTGGQPVDGPISVGEIIHQVRHEGVARIVLLSDDPERHRGNPDIPNDIRIGHRDQLDTVQRELRDVPGCTILVYEQTCAAEKRRRRKRGQYPDPPKRLFISEEVCEGCGDCSVQSTCVSLVPIETDFGTKRRIDQSSCNKDYSCLNGFCPSFVTVYDAKPRKPEAVTIDSAVLASLPPAPRRPIASSGFGMMVAGIGGTGVITVGAILGMAAHMEGLAASLFDMTGLAQKNGAVFSHVRIAARPDVLHAQKLGRGEADVLLAFDLVAALADDAAATLAFERTEAVVNADIAPTVAFQFDREASVDAHLLAKRLARKVDSSRIDTVGATRLAETLLGDPLGANLFLVGVAAQRGMLPVGTDAIEQAIRLNGTAVAFNLSAFALGRLFVADRARLESMAVRPQRELTRTLDDIIARQKAHLCAYQDERLARRYQNLVMRVREKETALAGDSEDLTMAVARTYARLLSYKDEYEVARLLSGAALKASIEAAFEPGARLEFNLAPPILGGAPVNGRPRKRAFSARWMLPLLKLLASGRKLRGTPFDIFARTAERRSERQLIADYELLVERVLAQLTPVNRRAAAALLSLASEIRGYGPVKEAAITDYYRQVARAEAGLAQAASQSVAA